MCLRSCKPPFGISGKPCTECAADYAEWLDFLPLWTRELARCRGYARAIPATDQEWADYLGQVAPVVIDDNNLTFTYST